MSDSPTVVADIMTREVVTLFEEENLELLEEGMERYRFRHLPVVDDGKVVGLVTQLDILRALASSLDPAGAAHSASIKSKFFVADIMTRDVVMVRPQTPLVEAARLMHDKKLGCLPVTEPDGALVGIVTTGDLLKLLMALLEP